MTVCPAVVTVVGLAVLSRVTLAVSTVAVPVPVTGVSDPGGVPLAVAVSLNDPASKLAVVTV